MYLACKIVFSILLKILRKNIYSFFNLVLIIVNLKIILKEFLSSITLFKTPIFYIYKITNFVIIYKEKIFLFTIFWIIKPGFNYFNNS